MNVIDKLKEGPIILDNILPLELSKNLQEQIYKVTPFILGDSYKGTSGFSNDDIKEHNLQNLYEQFQLGTSIVDSKNNYSNSEYYHLYSLPLTLLSLKLNIPFNINNFFRCKINCQFKAPKESKGKYNWPHTDIEKEDGVDVNDYITVLYYVNDSDGDTYFFNQKNMNMLDVGNVGSLTIKEQVTPKQGRIVLFNAGDIHAGSHPVVNDFRIVINYNVKIR